MISNIDDVRIFITGVVYYQPNPFMERGMVQRLQKPRSLDTYWSIHPEDIPIMQQLLPDCSFELAFPEISEY